MTLDLLIAVVISAFASFRIGELVAIDEGAFSMFFKLRIWAGSYDLGENGEPKTLLGRMFKCPYCIGIYPAFFCALWFDHSATLPLTWFAIAGGQAFLQTIGGRNA